jgi:hypothetical protein
MELSRTDLYSTGKHRNVFNWYGDGQLHWKEPLPNKYESILETERAPIRAGLKEYLETGDLALKLKKDDVDYLATLLVDAKFGVLDQSLESSSNNIESLVAEMKSSEGNVMTKDFQSKLYLEMSGYLSLLSKKYLADMWREDYTYNELVQLSHLYATLQEISSSDIFVMMRCGFDTDIRVGKKYISILADRKQSTFREIIDSAKRSPARFPKIIQRAFAESAQLA